MSNSAKRQPLIFVSNDDSINASGLASLIEMMQPLGRLLVVVPSRPQSGMSHAMTTTMPLRVIKLKESADLTIYTCNGTPADCVKLGMNTLLPFKPDLLVSGINHGSNSSISVVYSGTMAAAAEGVFYRVPSIGFSLCNYAHDADFSATIPYGRTIARQILEQGLPEGIALNVNFPDLALERIQGIKVCRQNKGTWREKFDLRTDPHGEEYYWLSGSYENHEPEAGDTDEAALAAGYISVVPTHFDLTAHHFIENLKVSFENGHHKH